MNKNKLGVFLGRMHPFHKGHKQIIDNMLNMHEYILIIIGSADKSLELRNPLTADLRKKILEDEYKDLLNNRVYIITLNDLSTEEDNSFAWGSYLEKTIASHARQIVIAKYEERVFKDSLPVGTQTIVKNYDYCRNGAVLHYSDDMRIISQWFDWKETKLEFFIHNRSRYQNGVSATDIREQIMFGTKDPNEYNDTCCHLECTIDVTDKWNPLTPMIVNQIAHIWDLPKSTAYYIKEVWAQLWDTYYKIKNLENTKILEGE